VNIFNIELRVGLHIATAEPWLKE